MSCSRRGSHLLHGNDCRPVVYVVASVEDLDAIAHLGRAELGRGRRRGPPGRRPRPASWIFRCHGGFFIMLAAVGPGATILVLAPGLSTRCTTRSSTDLSLHAPCSKSNVQGSSRIQRKTGTLRYFMACPVVLCVSTQVHATRPFTALRACLAGQQVLPCPWRLWALAALRSSARPSRGGCLRQRLPNAALLAKMLVASELFVRQCRV